MTKSKFIINMFWFENGLNYFKPKKLKIFRKKLFSKHF